MTTAKDPKNEKKAKALKKANDKFRKQMNLTGKLAMEIKEGKVRDNTHRCLLRVAFMLMVTQVIEEQKAIEEAKKQAERERLEAEERVCN